MRDKEIKVGVSGSDNLSVSLTHTTSQPFAVPAQAKLAGGNTWESTESA